MTTFIKAEEQNYSLYSYVNQLNQETDILEENNRYLDQEIERYEQLSKMTTQELQDRLSQMRAHANDLKAEIKEANSQCSSMQNNFQEVQQMVQKMVEKFKTAKFTAKVAATQHYDENTVFNENNVTNYLAELEEYISNLITFVSIQRNDVNAAISSVPLDTLTVKTHDNTQLKIDAPPEASQNYPPEFEDEGGEESTCYDAKELYRRYAEHMEKQQEKANDI